ncbi:hypothetical protein, partial [Bradyrhizobium sp.]|uniref:hypothetical protein n=1 Tax=Bradyrhizobium sp. TaxID=376 RepID=UPI0025C2BB58
VFLACQLRMALIAVAMALSVALGQHVHSCLSPFNRAAILESVGDARDMAVAVAGVEFPTHLLPALLSKSRGFKSRPGFELVP